MPGKIKVKVLAGRNLPVMDRAGDTTDAFVEIKFGGVTHKTDVCRKSLNPHWNSTEWYRFEVDESELQDEPLQLRLMDHDTYSANDAIGKVVISLAPLLARESVGTDKGNTSHSGAMMSGWIPVFDTMHGIRGELNLIVKVELFSDFNKYKTSSCGVQFFHSPMIPPGYKASAIHGFVEELVVNDDPEYQWIDKIRTPRASNEARQVAFIKLSNQVQRLVGVKAAELGANAVVGYQQDFDLEGEAGVVARAIGTAVSIEPLPIPTQIQSAPPCSQQQLKKYLGILTTGEENVTDLNQYFQSHQEELNKLINILHPKFSSNFLDDEVVEEDEKCPDLSRQCSIKSYTDNASIFQDDYASSKSMKAISDDQTDLNKFLSKTIDELDTDNQAGPMTRIKKTKKNFFTRRLSSIRSRKSDKGDDSISIKSNSSDGSKLSFSDIKKEFKKLKRIKAPKIIKVEEDDDDGGSGMASILARSIIHAHTSLACIAESQDSEHSPSSTMRHTSESEPAISVYDEEVNKTGNPDLVTETTVNVPIDFSKKRRSSSLKDLKSKNHDGLKPQPCNLSESCPNTPTVSRNELLLKLPGNNSIFGSNSSALSESSEMYSSSEADDDESDDPKTDKDTDTDKSIETTSSIVQSVVSKKADPKIIAQMDRKLSVLDCVTPEPPNDMQRDDSSSSNPDEIKEMKESVNANIKKSINSVKHAHEPTTSSDKDSKKSSKRPSLIFKFHNPFAHKKSISAPSSPIEKKTLMSKSSDKIKQQWSKTKSSMIRSISHTFLHRRKNSQNSTQSNCNISQPNSGSDLNSKASHETVLGSPFLSYTDLVNLDKETKFENYKLFKKDNKDETVKMYIGSEPASRASVSGPSSPHYGKDDYSLHEQLHKHKKEKPEIVKPTGLIHTAMETILIDKVQSLLIPTTPDPDLAEKLFFDDVNKRLEKVEDERKSIKEVQSKPSESSLSDITIDTVIETKNINKDSSQGFKESLPEVTVKSVMESESVVKEQNSLDKHKRLTRQDSIHSLNLEETEQDPEKELPPKIDVTNIIINPRKTQTPVLQHFHPILCGIKSSKLETIPSLPESSSLDRAQSLDTDGLDSSSNLDDASSSVINQHVVECSDSFDRIDRDLRDGDKLERESSPQHSRHESCGAKELVPSSGVNASLNATSTPVGIHRRSSDSDLSITPKASSLNTSTIQGSGGGAILRPSMNSNNLDMLEYPFLTMTKFPPGFIVHLGGCVTARAVKLLEGGGAGGDEARAAWWSELRTELRAHARAARCHAVIAYTESATICEEVCVLSASGTAAVINLDCDLNVDPELYVSVNNQRNTEDLNRDCSIGHIPYSAECGPYRAELAPCLHCRRAKVPAVLLATCSKPTGLASTGKAILLTACAARVRRAPPQSEPGARDISDQLPFLEYELHKLLLAKLRMQGANAIFDLRTQLAIGARCVTALAYGTAVRLNALPPPTLPSVKSSTNDKEAIDIQKALWNTFNANKTANGYDMVQIALQSNGVISESESISPPVLDLCSDKDACVLELDETEDVETVKSLALRRNDMEIYCDGMIAKPNMPPQAFAQIWRARFPLSACASASAACVRHVTRAADGVSYKLRRLRPTALAAPHIHVELPEDEIQFVISGTAIPLRSTPPLEPNATSLNRGDDAIFTLDEEQKVVPAVSDNTQQSSRVLLTSLSSVRGAKISQRVCALRSLFVRETTAVREMGGMSGFLHTFHCEVLAIVRASTAALGGNALTSFYIRQLMLQDNAHKNQGQCLLSVGGDVVHITY